MFASQCKITRNYRYFRVFQVTIQSFSINGARSLFDYAQFCSARFFGWYDALKEVLGFCGVWCAHLKIAYFSVNNKHEFIPWISWKFSICPHNRQKKNAYYLFSLNKIIKAQQAKYLPAAMGIRPFYAIMQHFCDALGNQSGVVCTFLLIIWNRFHAPALFVTHIHNNVKMSKQNGSVCILIFKKIQRNHQLNLLENIYLKLQYSVVGLIA